MGKVGDELYGVVTEGGAGVVSWRGEEVTTSAF